ncbi:hypothetical protein [Roseococcus sp. YIM B11640]|uniref:hypothetical protein n=1 Tax=Roseococcus sp. YIM B11640 TaxID=3133973 RepID=UPI003C7ED179
MARRFPVFAICAAAIAASSGIAVLAVAEPQQPRACRDGEVVAERFYASEAADDAGHRVAIYYMEVANPNLRPQVFNLVFQKDGLADRRAEGRAIAIPGGASLPLVLGRQPIGDEGRAMSPGEIEKSVRLSCRGW